MDVVDSPQADSRVDAERLHAQGLAAARSHHFDRAIELFQASLQLDPASSEAIRHLAQAYADAGRLPESESTWERYIQLHPEESRAHRRLGNLRRRMEKLDASVESLKKALSLDSQSASNHVDLGLSLLQAKRLPEAKQAFWDALQIEPDQFDAHLNMGMLLQEQKNSEEAMSHLRRAIGIRPNDPNGHNNLGVVLAEQERFDDAIACYEELVRRIPDYALAWNNMGNALRSVGRLDEAQAALAKALELKPDYAEAHNNLGIIYTQMEKFAEAIQSYNRALLLRPDYPEAHANRGLVYLLKGDFQQGWSDYEWRWHHKGGLKRRSYPGKVWDGSPLSGKRILLYYEQGLGDTFQFIRYAKELKARGATVMFECQPHTRQILSRTPGIDTFIIRGEKPPAVDFFAPLLSLPGLCQTNLDNLPRRIPYIFGDPALTWEWKQRMRDIHGFRIGIAWQGNPQHKGDRIRSIPLKTFASIANIPGVKLISLQKNKGVEQIPELDGLFNLIDFKDVAEDSDGWLRTAAIVSNLDLVISADTSVIHLCGAMGVPVWAAISTSPDWRWLLNRDDTPWYPTMQLFRQSRPKDWEGVFERIAQALSDRLSQSAHHASDPLATEAERLDAEGLIKRGTKHLERGELSEAQSAFEQAVQKDPSHAKAQQNLGVVYAKQGRLREAVARFRRALELSPDSPGLYANLGLACTHLGQLEEAVSHLRKAIWLGASSADTYKNLGRALMGKPDPAAAEECYWAALRLQPDDVEAHYQLSQALLMQGKFENGWLEYEWRWKWQKRSRQHRDRPRWAGQSLQGKRLLLTSESDPRDVIQMSRYAAVLADQGAEILLECPDSLAPLMKGCLAIRETITPTQPSPEHDYHVPLSSLPAILGTTSDTIPASRPYLGVNSTTVDRWQQLFDGDSNPQIGIAFEADVDPAAHLAFLKAKLSALWADIEGATFINLQPVQQENLGPKIRSIYDFGEAIADPTENLADSAAIIRNLDLLIAVDNTLAHIGGAMGIPTWTILSYVTHPRWLVHRNNSPWYPTMSLYRQQMKGNSDELANRVAMSLRSNLRRRVSGSGESSELKS